MFAPIGTFYKVRDVVPCSGVRGNRNLRISLRSNIPLVFPFFYLYFDALLDPLPIGLALKKYTKSKMF